MSITKSHGKLVITKIVHLELVWLTKLVFLLNSLQGYKSRVPYLKPRFYSLYWPLGSAHDCQLKLTFTLQKFKTRAAGSGQASSTKALPSAARAPGIHPENPYARSFSSIYPAQVLYVYRKDRMYTTGSLEGRGGQAASVRFGYWPRCGKLGLESIWASIFCCPATVIRVCITCQGASWVFLDAIRCWVALQSSCAALHCIASSRLLPLHFQITPYISWCGHGALEFSHACGPAFHIGCVGELLCGDGGAVVGPVALHWAEVLCEKWLSLSVEEEWKLWVGEALGQG